MKRHNLNPLTALLDTIDSLISTVNPSLPLKPLMLYLYKRPSQIDLQSQLQKDVGLCAPKSTKWKFGVYYTVIESKLHPSVQLHVHLLYNRGKHYFL